MRLNCVIAVTVVTALSFIVGSARAQSPAPAAPPAPPAPTLVPIPTRTYIGFNPLGLPADVGTVELETAIASGVTFGGVGSYIDADNRRFTTFDFKARYYPAGVVLRGSSIGVTAGYTKFSNLVNDVRQTLTAPTLGIILDHNWLYGRDQRFLVGTGVGAKRVLASRTDRDRADVDRAIFTVRMIIGFAF